MNKYPRKTQNVISHYVKTLPSNVIPKFPPLFIEFIKYYLNEQTDESVSNSNNNNNNTILCSNESIKASPPATGSFKAPLHRNSNSHLSNSKRNSSNSSLSTFAHNKGSARKSNSSIPLNRTKSIQSTFNNSINSIPSSYSETSSYYYNNHKRSLPGNLCLITKPAEFNEIQITLRELFLDLYNDDLLSQYFYPIFIDFSHENIFAFWLKDDEENNYSSQGSPYWGMNSFQSSRTGTKHTSLGIGSNLLNYSMSIGNLPIVKIGLEKQRIAVIAKNLNSFLSLLTQTSFVNNIVRNYRIGGGDESTVLSSEGSSDEEYNSIQDMMRFDGDFFEDEMSSNASTVSIENDPNRSHHHLTETSDGLMNSSYFEDEEEDDDEEEEEEDVEAVVNVGIGIDNNADESSHGDKNEIEDEKETVRDEHSAEDKTNEQFTIEIENNEGDDKQEKLENNTDLDHSSTVKNDSKNKEKIEKNENKIYETSYDSVKEDLKNNDEIIYILSENENEDEDENEFKNESEIKEKENEVENESEIKGKEDEIKNESEIKEKENRVENESKSKNGNKNEIQNEDEKENEHENYKEIEIEDENITEEEEEEIDPLSSDGETLSSSITDRHTHCRRNDFGYDSDVKLNSKQSSMDSIVNDNSLPNSFPYNRRFTDDYEKMNKSEMNFRRYSYASSINSTLTTVSASPFAIRTMFQQQETQMAYIEWYNEICKRENINLDNSDEIEKKLLKKDTILRSPSISSLRSNNRKYLSLDSYQLNKAYYDNSSNLKRNHSTNKDYMVKGGSHIQTKYNSRPISLWDSILDKNRHSGLEKSSSFITNNSNDQSNNTSMTTTTNNNENKNNSSNGNYNNDINTSHGNNSGINTSHGNNNGINNSHNHSHGNDNGIKTNYISNENKDLYSEFSSSNIIITENDKNRKQKTSKSKKSSSKLLVKSISQTLTKSASQAPKQIKRRLKGNSSLQKLKLKDGSLLNIKSKSKESSGHHHSGQKATSPYSKKMVNTNEMLPPPSSALSKNISSFSRAKVSSPLSQRNHQDGYLKPRKNVPTTFTTMMTISNNLNHTHNSSVTSKTSPKIPSKLHQNFSVNRYRTNSSPAPIYSSKSNNRMINIIRQRTNNKRISPISPNNSSMNGSSFNTTTTTTTTTNTTTSDNNNNNKNSLSTTTSNNKENSSISATFNGNTVTSVNANTTKGDKPSPTPLQINTSLSKKDSKETIKSSTTPKTAPPFFSSENNIFTNFFGNKKFNKFNGFSFLSNIPIVAKLLNLDKDNDNNNTNNNNTNNNNINNDSTTTTTNDSNNNTNSSTENQDNKNNLPIDITRQGSMHKNFEKSPEKSTFSTYTNNSGNNINYVTSSTLASQILEKERKGIPEPEQWLQKQVKARAYAFAVANAVAKRNTQKGINHNDYSQYTTKFTPTNHLPFTQKQPKTSVETTTVVATKYHKDDTKRKQFVEDDAFFML